MDNWQRVQTNIERLYLEFGTEKFQHAEAQALLGSFKACAELVASKNLKNTGNNTYKIAIGAKHD